MRDATGQVQSVLVLGGNSDIGWALVERLVAQRLRRVVLAGPNTDAMSMRAATLPPDGPEVEVFEYDALDDQSHGRVLRQAQLGGDIDIVVVCFGVLGEPFELLGNPEDSAAIASLNFTATVAAIQSAAAALRTQGHGTLVVLSSVAGRRVRPENAVYGASKAGVDGFALAMADELHGSGVDVMVVRPGFVRSKMTEGRKATPFATTPDRVAADIMSGLERRRRIVWSPPILRLVFTVLRLLPGPIWRRVTS
jgi:decaprenylphospho-beta-D-erythro-pentofuranosid-2-ulose 2-reductase